MGVRRKTLILGFSIALFLGVAVYFRLWSMDSRDASFTADDREVLRRQFERANMEAMDESAGWRMKFDGEYERSKRLQEELSKVKGALEGAEDRLAVLRKFIVSGKC
ncbi:uncharacterized protein LOC109849087 isoform X2 [Asparagus officinalis]|uniref:uncharacterized protein LOC109849087 isoform X2 n=1 Tax=Asparagus officinalis TaxID=4686 RepID=UPI00098E5025|nr:uncharacterized protein LOC109849087 isoform X2 [Asparagus officinalis]